MQKTNITKKWLVGFITFVTMTALFTWGISRIDNKFNTVEVIEEVSPVIIDDYKYLADNDEVWTMILDNYGIKKTDDTYATFKEIEDAERKLGIFNCDLLGIALKESRLNQFAKGDSGSSWGVFQINSYYHDVSQRTAFMVDSAATWTYNNLLENGYNDSRVYAIARHNGSINLQVVQAYAFKVMLAAERICNLK